MKTFIFDTLVEEENICNLAKERGAILEAIAKKRKLIIYGPRNFGKTSLAKNVVIPAFKRRHRKCFVLFADLMGVKNWAGIEQRIERSFSISFAEAFPAKKLVETAKNFLASLRPQVVFDAQTGAPSISFAPDTSRRSFVHTEDIFRVVTSIGREHPSLVIFDEFQDIAFIKEAEAKFRAAFQEMGSIPLILMGSKRHILSNIFARPDAPLASFGQDLEFHAIPYEEYCDYIAERFTLRRLTIDLATATALQNMLNRIPESINMVCAHILDHFNNAVITDSMVIDAIASVVESRQSRFEQLLAGFSSKEEETLVAVAKNEPVLHYNGTSFLKTVSISSRMVGVIMNNLWNKSVLNHNREGYSVADPLLREYLRRYR